MSKRKTADDMLQLVGDTPLVRLYRVAPANGSQLYGKLEARNPTGSVKDRIGVSMIRAAEATGQLKKGMTIVEPTSGNTGIALALTAAVLGYRLVLTMPESMSLERRQVMASYGAEIVLTPAAEDMPGAIRKAEELKAANPEGVFIPQQFSNPANPEAHRRSHGRGDSRGYWRRTRRLCRRSGNWRHHNWRWGGAQAGRAGCAHSSSRA